MCGLYQFFVCYALGVVGKVDGACVGEAVLFEHAAHDDVAAVGVDAQGALFGGAGFLCREVDNFRGDSLSAQAYRYGDAVDGEIVG